MLFVKDRIEASRVLVDAGIRGPVSRLVSSLDQANTKWCEQSASIVAGVVRCVRCDDATVGRKHNGRVDRRPPARLLALTPRVSERRVLFAYVDDGGHLRRGPVLISHALVGRELRDAFGVSRFQLHRWRMKWRFRIKKKK